MREAIMVGTECVGTDIAHAVGQLSDECGHYRA